MYILKSVIAIRGMENGMEADLIDEYRKLIEEHYEEYAIAEILLECKEEISGELTGG